MAAACEASAAHLKLAQQLAGRKRMKAAREAQIAAEKRNRELRAKGMPTPRDLHKAAQRAKFEAKKLDPNWKPTVRNERGFIIEVSSDGHTTLRDPGDWHKRRNRRFRLISTGVIASTQPGW